MTLFNKNTEIVHHYSGYQDIIIKSKILILIVLEISLY